MGTSRRSPDRFEVFTADAAMVDGAACVAGSAEESVALPAAANTAVPFRGLVFKGAVANGPVEVVTAGIYPGIAGTSINKGDKLTSYDNTGAVGPASPGAGVNVAIIGVAVESASAGERVAMEIIRDLIQG